MVKIIIRVFEPLDNELFAFLNKIVDTPFSILSLGGLAFLRKTLVQMIKQPVSQNGQNYGI